MDWKDVLKEEDKQERWNRYRESLERAKKERRSNYQRKPEQPRYKCGMCGRKLSYYDKEHKRGQLNFCKACKERRGNKD
ncbi:hypothetical protein QKV95_gp107 [Poseidoniales virus YSH_150918]|uniref:Uncharacterized protein n=1 Tax=Poseidoniales virus YSH_150918 TaxID=3071324 RepID=A0A976UB20_9CAUD|nr:hypothetical protein QKV95_gp107 [Yangshan Harbor Poseidoniales virus]UVF62584.1 hypothetical protein [Poseidoniales virus YSH_150918]